MLAIVGFAGQAHMMEHCSDDQGLANVRIVDRAALSETRA